MLSAAIDRSGSILDAEGNWTAEEGRYKKAKLCAEHDLDVSDLYCQMLTFSLEIFASSILFILISYQQSLVDGQRFS